MKYLLLICRDPAIEMSPEDMEAMPGLTTTWIEELDGRGARLQGNQLQPVTDATTVRIRSDEVLISDGPFAETKEQVVGFDIIQCGDLDEALEVASKHPVARFGSIEVRPFWEP